MNDLGCLPSGEEPLPRNALSGARLEPSPAPRLGHRGAGCRRLCTPPSLLAETVRAGSLSTRSAASGRHASLNLDDVRRLLQPNTTHGHTRRAIDPRTRVRLSPRYTPAPTDASCVGRRRCVAAPWACEPPPTHAGFRTSCSACAEKWVTGRNTRAKASRALLTMSRVPSSWCPGHPGRRFESSSGLDDPALPRPGLDPPWMRPHEGPHRRKDRGAFGCDGTLTRARDCSLVRA
jgi:hypothetical protein